MAGQRGIEQTQGWFFTAPWDAPVRRRGDALGLRGLTDRYADALAPDLSNGTVDARWLTLLSWCLKASHDVWAHAEGGNLGTREVQRRRYAWLRPLELLWVTWTLQAQEDAGGRQLPGQRSVRNWLDGGMRAKRFGMRPDQYRRYRQTGVYGAYRTLLRSIPGLTLGERGRDGWTPSEGVNALFRYVNASLPRGARFTDTILERTHWQRWHEQEERWWMNRGWGVDAVRTSHLFPTEGGSAKRLPEEERMLLKRYLFPSDHRRLLVAQLLSEVEPGLRHVDLCDHLAGASSLKGSEAGPLLATLPAFTRLADAGMDAMRALWTAVGASDQARGPEAADLASHSDIREALHGLTESARVWNARSDTSTLPAGGAASALANALATANTSTEQLRLLAQHHEMHGGGLRWFRLRRGRIEPLLPHGGATASPYRFRLWPLARLSAQCGAADTRAALEAAASRDVEETDGGDET